MGLISAGNEITKTQFGLGKEDAEKKSRKSEEEDERSEMNRQSLKQGPSVSGYKRAKSVRTESSHPKLHKLCLKTILTIRKGKKDLPYEDTSCPIRLGELLLA